MVLTADAVTMTVVEGVVVVVEVRCVSRQIQTVDTKPLAWAKKLLNFEDAVFVLDELNGFGLVALFASTVTVELAVSVSVDVVVVVVVVIGTETTEYA